PWTIRNGLVTHTLLPLDARRGEGLFMSARQYAGDISYQITLAEWDRIIGDEEARARAVHAAMDAESDSSGVQPSVRFALRLDQSYQGDAVRLFRTLSPAQIVRGMPLRLRHLWGVGDWGTGLTHRISQVDYVLMTLLIAVGCRLNYAKLRTHWLVWLI